MAICSFVVTSEVSSLKNVNGPEEQSDARGSLMWSSTIWIYLEMHSGDILFAFCGAGAWSKYFLISSLLQAATSSTIDLKLCKWTQFSLSTTM